MVSFPAPSTLIALTPRNHTSPPRPMKSRTKKANGIITPSQQACYQAQHQHSMSPAAAMCVADSGHSGNNAEVNKAIQATADVSMQQKGTGPRGATMNGAPAPITSMETEYIEALYAATVCSQLQRDIGPDNARESHLEDPIADNSTSGSEDLDFDDLASYDHGEDGDCEDSDDELDDYEHDNFLSVHEAVLMELRREQVEFEENVRQLQQQLQKEGSIFPLSLNDTPELEHITNSDACSDDSANQPTNAIERTSPHLESDTHDRISVQAHKLAHQRSKKAVCVFCQEPKSSLCFENLGWVWRPLIVEALATAAAAITMFKARKDQEPYKRTSLLSQEQVLGHTNGVGKELSQDRKFSYYSRLTRESRTGSIGDELRSQEIFSDGRFPDSGHASYPLPPNSPYTFRRKSSEYLEPVGEFQEFQSAEGNSRQVLMHVWPPSELDTALLKKLEACCRDFQENEIVRGHSGDGFLNGWRPSWLQQNRTGVLRFGHWRVRAPDNPEEQLYAPFQTPLTLAAGGGTVLGSTVNLSASLDDSLPSLNSRESAQRGHHHACSSRGGVIQQEDNRSEGASSPAHHPYHCNEHKTEYDHIINHTDPQADSQLESSTQKRLLRLVRSIQMVEKGIIARHLKYLFPTLYEKYHGLQFGTPRLFDAVATVAMAVDVAPRLHHDRAHTRHGFCWIVACGDFVGGDLCIPELGKRVVMRPGTVVAIRSTVVAYYIERYAKGTNMYTMYAYTADNCWPPALE